MPKGIRITITQSHTIVTQRAKRLRLQMPHASSANSGPTARSGDPELGPNAVGVGVGVGGGPPPFGVAVGAGVGVHVGWFPCPGFSQPCPGGPGVGEGGSGSHVSFGANGAPQLLP